MSDFDAVFYGNFSPLLVLATFLSVTGSLPGKKKGGELEEADDYLLVVAADIVVLKRSSIVKSIASQAENITILISYIKMSKFSHLASKLRAPVEMQELISSIFLICSCAYDVMATPILVSQISVRLAR